MKESRIQTFFERYSFPEHNKAKLMYFSVSKHKTQRKEYGERGGKEKCSCRVDLVESCWNWDEIRTKDGLSFHMR